MNETIQIAANAWLADPAIADADKSEIHALVDAKNHAELADRFAIIVPTADKLPG